MSSAHLSPPLRSEAAHTIERPDARRVRVFAAALLAALGLTALAGWLSGRLVLASVDGRFIPMAPLTALAFVLGPRRSKRFLTINCSAVVETLFESELFGHMRGAFTGATDNKAGLFEAADGGTLFLDEVGELPGAVQAKLLRVLETGEVQRVGSLQTKTVDVRIVAATNRDLLVEAEAGRFRSDLFYRLNVIELRLPPLRERPEDIPYLTAAFIRDHRL